MILSGTGLDRHICHVLGHDWHCTKCIENYVFYRQLRKLLSSPELLVFL